MHYLGNQPEFLLFNVFFLVTDLNSSVLFCCLFRICSVTKKTEVTKRKTEF